MFLWNDEEEMRFTAQLVNSLTSVSGKRSPRRNLEARQNSSRKPQIPPGRPLGVAPCQDFAKMAKESRGLKGEGLNKAQLSASTFQRKLSRGTFRDTPRTFGTKDEKISVLKVSS